MLPVYLSPGPTLTLCDDGSNVTTTAHEYLFSPVTIAPGVLLKDIFRLISPNPFLLGVFTQGYAKELCAEMLKGPIDSPDSFLEYIELRPNWTVHSVTRTYETVGTYDVHGISKECGEDVYIEGTLLCTKGGRIAYGLSLPPVRALLMLPVKVRDSVVVQEADLDSKQFGGPVHGAHEYTIPPITLGALIHELLFELSWHGTPEQTHHTAQAAETGCDGYALATWARMSSPSLLAAAAKSEALLESLFASWKPATKVEILEYLDSLEDDAVVGPHFFVQFGGHVVVLPKFYELDARSFRKEVREAQQRG